MKKAAKILLVLVVILFIPFAISCVGYVIIRPESYHKSAPLWVNIMAMLWIVPMTIGILILLFVNREDIFRDLKKYINS